MKKNKKLKKIIEYAVERGYKPDGILGAVLRGEMGVGLDPNIYNHIVRDRQYYIHIFSHDFAQAVCSEKDPCDCGEDKQKGGMWHKPNWITLLEEAVTSGDPIDHCYKFIKQKKLEEAKEWFDKGLEEVINNNHEK